MTEDDLLRAARYHELRNALDAVTVAHECIADAHAAFKTAVRELALIATKAACDFPDAVFQDIADEARGNSEHLRWCRMPAGASERLYELISRSDDDDDGSDEDDPDITPGGGPDERVTA